MSGVVIAKNALYNALAFVLTLVVTFLLIPVMLAYLGPTGFGVWAIARVFVSYASLSDFGLSSTVTKFVAEHHAKNDSEQLGRTLSAALLLYLLIAITILLLVWLTQDLLVQLFFSTSGEFASDVHFVLLGSIIIFAVTLVGSIFTSALNGLQRMDITNLITALFWLVNGVLMYLALVFGYGLRGIVWANAIAAIVSLLLGGGAFLYFFRHVFLSVIHARWSDIRESVRYSKDIFLIAIANSVHLHYDKLLLSSFVSLGTVANYEVASRVIQVMRQVIVLLLNPIVPVASELEAQARFESISRLYYRSIKYLAAFLIPFFATVGVFAQYLLTLWLGEFDVRVLVTLQVLLIPNFINLMTGPAYFISIGTGKARFGMYSSLIGLGLNLVLSFFLLRSFGYDGLLAGTFIALSVEAGFFFVLFHRSIGISWKSFFTFFVRPLATISLALIIGFASGSVTDHLLPKTILMVLVTVGTYAIMLWWQQYFTKEDKDFFQELCGRLTSKIFVASE